MGAKCVDYWVIPYGIETYLLTDNGPQFVKKVFATLCAFPGEKFFTTTANNPQNNDQTERYNKKIVSRRHYYVTEHRRNWDQYVKPWYTTIMRRFTGRLEPPYLVWYSPGNSLDPPARRMRKCYLRNRMVVAGTKAEAVVTETFAEHAHGWKDRHVSPGLVQEVLRKYCTGEYHRGPQGKMSRNRPPTWNGPNSRR